MKAAAASVLQSAAGPVHLRSGECGAEPARFITGLPVPAGL